MEHSLSVPGSYLVTVVSSHITLIFCGNPKAEDPTASPSAAGDAVVGPVASGVGPAAAQVCQESRKFVTRPAALAVNVTRPAALAVDVTRPAALAVGVTRPSALAAEVTKPDY